jgi:hypothetical protein
MKSLFFTRPFEMKMHINRIFIKILFKIWFYIYYIINYIIFKLTIDKISIKYPMIIIIMLKIN